MHDKVKNDRLSEAERHHAFLSALLDGEADELELRRFLKTSGQAEQVHIEKLGRYALASALLHDEVAEFPPTCSKHFTARVSAAIASEETHGESDVASGADASAPNAQRSSLLPLFGKFAIAASVAMAVILGAQYNTLLQPEPVREAVSNLVVAETTQAGDTVLDRQLDAEARVAELKMMAHDVYPRTAARDLAKASLENEQRERINSLLRYHYERSAANGSRGMIPVARINTVEEQR